MDQSLISIIKSKRLKRLTGETAWIFVSRISVGLGMFVTTRVITELLEPTVFGIVGMLLAGQLMVKQFISDPIALGAPRIYADRSTIGKNLVPAYKASSNLLWLTIIFGGIIGVGILIYGNGNTWEISAPAIAIVAVYHILFTRRNFETNILNAIRQQKIFALWQGVESWLKVALAALACFVLGRSAASVIVGYTAGIAAGFVLFAGKLEPNLKTRRLKPEVNEYKQARREIFRMSIPLIPGGIAIWMTMFGDRLLIGHFLGTEPAGLYIANASPVGVPIAMLGGIISSALLPILYRYSSEGKQDQLIKIRWVWLGLIALWGTIAVICIALFSKYIAMLALAEEYRQASYIMPWIGAAFACFSLAQSCENILLANKHTNYVMASQITGAVVHVCLLLILIQHYGILGVAISKLVGYATEAVMAFLLSNKSMAKMQMSEEKKTG